VSDINITFYSLSDYNAGLLIPKTFDLESLTNYDELSEARTKWLEELTATKNDGELREEYIVCDYEGIPSELVGEWDIDRNFGDYLEMVNKHSESLVNAALALQIPLDKIEDAYHGEFKSDTDLAYALVDETGMLSEVPESVKNYFDYERFGHDLAMNDYSEFNGHYFHANW